MKRQKIILSPIKNTAFNDANHLQNLAVIQARIPVLRLIQVFFILKNSHDFIVFSQILVSFLNKKET